MFPMPATSVTVYFDGQCPLCAREIAHYRGHVHDTSVSFVDIAGDDFDAARYGLDRDRVRQVFHVKVDDAMHTGIDAVIAMWHAVPRYRWLARLARLPGVYAVANLGYRVFARFRPYLRRRARHACASGMCRVP
jgi:predicted DCC family thiol-disulfide oxidoreductase YuxK